MQQNIGTHTEMNHSKNTPIFDYQLKTLVIGLGETGYSCAKFLIKKNCPFDICDTRKQTPYEQQLIKELPEIELKHINKIDIELLQQYEQVVVSPGISVREDAFKQFRQQGKTLIGDIALFIQENLIEQKKPIIAVTGSNGKSTVVTLAEHILKQSGQKVIAGGNLGIPALDLLDSDADIYILELSSFQLETIPQQLFGQDIFISAVLLNVSEDHMDRYDSLDDYRRVKESIFKLSKYRVFNKNEWLLDETLKEKNYSEFSLNKPEKNGYGLINKEGQTYLAQSICCKQEPLYKQIMPANEIVITGKHNFSNILATLALLEPFALSDNTVNSAIKTYKGLAHRCEWVATIDNVNYYNDSKGTNAGATIAAINSYDRPKILIAGGIGKDADFCELAKIINQKVKHVLLMGKDALQIKNSIEYEQNSSSEKQTLLSIEIVENMQLAIKKAQQLAQTGELVLFSPACASFDMYKNYVERGNDFVNQVKQLIH
jgi:UDP-N-acetylmuramoylalanine--D-glutamate ligase